MGGNKNRYMGVIRRIPFYHSTQIFIYQYSIHTDSSGGGAKNVPH